MSGTWGRERERETGFFFFVPLRRWREEGVDEEREKLEWLLPAGRVTSQRRVRALGVQRTFLTFPGRAGPAHGGAVGPGSGTPSASSSCGAIFE